VSDSDWLAVVSTLMMLLKLMLVMRATPGECDALQHN